MQLFRSFSFTPFFGMAPSLYICFFDTVSFIVPLFFFFFLIIDCRIQFRLKFVIVIWIIEFNSFKGLGLAAYNNK